MPLLAQENSSTAANTTTNGNLNKSTVDNVPSEAVSNGNNTTDDNMTTSESSIISSTETPIEEGDVQ